MAKPILSDELWALNEPLLPRHAPSPQCGRPRLTDRATLTGILYVLHTCMSWEYLPCEMGCGNGMTSRRHLRDWQRAGVWVRLHDVARNQVTPVQPGRVETRQHQLGQRTPPEERSHRSGAVGGWRG